jgi:hypothetical protein
MEFTPEVRSMGILLGIAAWFGLAGVLAAGWARFFRRVGPTPRLEGIDWHRRDVA